MTNKNSIDLDLLFDHVTDNIYYLKHNWNGEREMNKQERLELITSIIKDVQTLVENGITFKS